MKKPAGYEFTVEESVEIKGRGWAHVGTMQALSEPLIGEAVVYGDGSPVMHTVTVLAWERFAIPHWWNLKCSALLTTRLPNGVKLRGNIRR